MQVLFSHLPGLLKMSGHASILILLVLAAQWLCGRRLQPRWRCALWLLVLLRLALPWTFPSPASLFNVLKIPAAAQHTPPETAPAPMMDAPISTAEGVAVAGSSAGGYWLAWLWAAGALCLASCAAVNHYKIHRRVTRRRPLIDGPTLNLLEDCKALMGVRTPVTLIETEAIESPTLFGFVRPRLLLPAGLASSFTRQELRHVFLHELAHIKRHDVLAGWLMLGLQTLHWFNPLVWLAFHRLRTDRELACDALALSYARPGENESYGLTIIKLLERFGQSVWAPSLAGILENKQQMKERIRMIAKFHKTDRGLALAVSLFAGLALVTLTDAQNVGNAAKSDHKGPQGASEELQKQTAQEAAEAASPGAIKKWNLQQKMTMADAGDQWAAYELWDAYYRGNHGIQPDPAQAKKWLGELVQDVWVVRFEPVDNFAPTGPGEFLARINQYSSSRSGQTNIGGASFFRTTIQGGKLVGSFLSNDPDELKVNLAKVPGLKVTSVERITPEEFIKYEQSPQESLWNLQQKLKLAEAGNKWAVYDLWDAYYRGNHGVQPNLAQADKWLGEFVQDVWVVRFEPVDDFAPTSPGEFLARINHHASTHSGGTNIGEASFFRTTNNQGGKLVGSFLSNYPDELKAALVKVPGLKVTSVERITPKEFIKYEQSPQESQ
jgi:beta-lactamase regulating signal transducer with metallopeptidase domain